MIDGGWAWAFVKYNARFKSRERAARHRGEGMWRLGAGIPPWEFRANGWRLAAQQAPRAECPIKGNISGAGRIYHMPWSRWYSRTHVEAARGERWFCTEAAARAAGWRPASRT